MPWRLVFVPWQPVFVPWDLWASVNSHYLAHIFLLESELKMNFFSLGMKGSI